MTVAIDIFRVLASCTSITMILSPIPNIYKVYKNKSTGHASILPLVAMFDNCHVVMMFGYLTKQYFPVFSTFIVGDVFSFAYVAIFYYFSHEKRKAHWIFLGVGLPLLVMSIYSLVGGFGYTNQSRRGVGNVVGYYSILAAILLYGAPMEKIGKVLKHRSAVFLPIHMVCAGTTNNLMWVVYASLTSEWLIFIPNCLSLVLGVFQLGLYVVFHPSTHPYHPTAGDDPIDVELGATLSPRELAVASAADSKSQLSTSPSFVPMASPLEPPHATAHTGQQSFVPMASPLEPPHATAHTGQQS